MSLYPFDGPDEVVTEFYNDNYYEIFKCFLLMVLFQIFLQKLKVQGRTLK